MRIAVTGSTGFIGQHVLRGLESQSDIQVVACSRAKQRPSGIPDSVQYVDLDVAKMHSDDYERLGRPDVLVHLAWSGLPNYRSLHHFESELPQQYAFLRSLVEAGLPSLLVAGTCYEYGMASGELVETALPVPANPYAYAKNALRQQLDFLRTKRRFALTWARLFYMHGPGQPATSLFPQLAAAVARGDASFAMSRGEQLRDYLSVESVARYITQLAIRCPGSDVVNICSGRPVSVRGLVEQLLARNGWRIDLDLGRYAYPDYEPMAFWGNAEKLRRLLGLQPDESLP
jgi:dTDP-6-deoxy-L-talose 4-dehydrogenase (NAD+)